VTAPCPAGTLAVGGGFQALVFGQDATDALVQRATPLDDFSGFRVDANRPTAWTLVVTAVCVNAIKL
jgi:hypothetical protein